MQEQATRKKNPKCAGTSSQEQERKTQARRRPAASCKSMHATRKKIPGARARRQERSFAVAKPALRRLAGCNVEGLVRPSVARCFAVAKPVLWRLEGCNLELARPISADPCRQQGAASEKRCFSPATTSLGPSSAGQKPADPTCAGRKPAARGHDEGGSWQCKRAGKVNVFS